MNVVKIFFQTCDDTTYKNYFNINKYLVELEQGEQLYLVICEDKCFKSDNS